MVVRKIRGVASRRLVRNELNRMVRIGSKHGDGK